ncbi:class I SAM-dependent methyltransferase [Patescibacteria group bacterium]|nr:class I SAM-dependent methyltransferase [Patescibacteria group bacterium]MDE1946761.1 class I SAM-dependent methyltransferase [Patescibacteria group bacterium]MDE2010936.1 class I SAM-dependent methyltransferase [Patescibacteria group bacterium]MDE2233619.1 class I SAM-dependent methyltransferase [Patescibacteria group bacterium]
MKTLNIDSIIPSFGIETVTESNFPAYVTFKKQVEIPSPTYWYYRFLLFLIKVIVKIRLGIIGQSYKKYRSPKHLNNDEVEKVYNREADSYERKHHLTTNFRDTWWRRQSGLDVISFVQEKSRMGEEVNLLDIATGVGLSIEEMLRVFRQYSVRLNITAIDYNKEMLRVANDIVLARIRKSGTLDGGNRLRFVRGDARSLSRASDGDGNTSEEFVKFKEGSVDCITIMFGIGGIHDFIDSYREQLKILKCGGIASINDMHKPVFDFSEKWPFYIGRKTRDIFSMMAWEIAAKPLALGTLWGWRDPSIDFHILPYICISDQKNNKYYGFKQKYFSLNNEFWWFKLPVVSTARIILEKVEIDRPEFERRNAIVESIFASN